MHEDIFVDFFKKNIFCLDFCLILGDFLDLLHEHSFSTQNGSILLGAELPIFEGRAKITKKSQTSETIPKKI